MVSATTLIRTGRLDHRIEERLRAYPEPIVRMESPLGNTNLYGLFSTSQPPYLMIISQQKDMIVNPSTGHNVLLTLTSRYEPRNLEVLEEVERVLFTRLNLPIPTAAHLGVPVWNEMFELFEFRPELAMRALSGR